MKRKDGKSEDSAYTCSDYRREMILISLKKQLASGNLTGEEKKALEKQVKELEAHTGLD